MIIRKVYLEALQRWKDKDVIKVVTGIRRCGKSTLMELFQQELLEQGVLPEQIIAVNLEDYENIELRDPRNLHSYILKKTENYGKNYVFLDEIQNVEDFPPMIDSLFAEESGSLHHRLQRVYAVRRTGDPSFRTLYYSGYAALVLCGISFLERRTGKPGPGLR